MKDGLEPWRQWRQTHRWFGVTTLPWGNSLTIRFFGLPIHISSWHMWIHLWKTRDFFGIFRRIPGTTLKRWGFRILGFEVGSRGGT